MEEKKYGVIKLGVLEFAPSVINDGYNIIINPTEDDYLRFGYKRVVYDEVPEYDNETQYLTEYYDEYETAICVRYVVNDNEIETIRETAEE